MTKTPEGNWKCDFCGKESAVKTNILEHIEATHVETPGYFCDICNHVCRTRGGLRVHKHSKHKQIKLTSIF